MQRIEGEIAPRALAVVASEDGDRGMGELMQAQAEDPADEDEGQRGGTGQTRVALPECRAKQAEREREAAYDLPVDAP